MFRRIDYFLLNSFIFLPRPRRNSSSNSRNRNNNCNRRNSSKLTPSKRSQVARWAATLSLLVTHPTPADFHPCWLPAYRCHLPPLLPFPDRKQARRRIRENNTKNASAAKPSPKAKTLHRHRHPVLNYFITIQLVIITLFCFFLFRRRLFNLISFFLSFSLSRPSSHNSQLRVYVLFSSYSFSLYYEYRWNRSSYHTVTSPSGFAGSKITNLPLPPGKWTIASVRWSNIFVFCCSFRTNLAMLATYRGLSTNYRSIDLSIFNNRVFAYLTLDDEINLRTYTFFFSTFFQAFPIKKWKNWCDWPKRNAEKKGLCKSYSSWKTKRIRHQLSHLTATNFILTATKTR